MRKIILLLLLIRLTYSCTEPYALQSNTFEDALIIEATITNELKKQEIKISRTFTFEQREPIIETGAIVYITDDLENQYNFNEINGKYVSEFEFEALPTRKYQLHIETSNGKKYSSTREVLPSTSNEFDITAKKNNLYGVEGLEITANSFDPTGTSNYYRFEYEETYKIVSPKWTPIKLNTSYNATNFEVTTWFTQKDYDSSICFNTEYSNEILLANNSGSNIDQIKDYSIRFIPQENYILAYRYSILVKQYVQNLEAYTFYKTLKDFSSEGSILSPNQPGFIEGNINNINDKSEKVIGFFDVSTLFQKRIFLNYNDIFEGSPVSKYHIDCEDFRTYYSPNLAVVDCNAPLPAPPPHELPPYCVNGKFALHMNVTFYKYEIFVAGEYETTIPICGECNRVFSNNVPDFWID
jgi:hypothetical protein